MNLSKPLNPALVAGIIDLDMSMIDCIIIASMSERVSRAYHDAHLRDVRLIRLCSTRDTTIVLMLACPECNSDDIDTNEVGATCCACGETWNLDSVERNERQPKLRGYQKIIADATGINDAQMLQEIEDCMRDDIFHSTLDWQSREVLEQGARDAVELLAGMDDEDHDRAWGDA